MKALFKKIKPEFVAESLGLSMAVYGLSLYSHALAWVGLGAFLVWLVESAN